QEIFQRREQIRAQASFLLANRIQIPAFEQQSKKPLSEILGFFGNNALSPNETINWLPIRAAKFFKRLFCSRRWTLRRQYDGPVRGSKCHRAVMRISANGGYRCHIVRGGGHMMIESKICAKHNPVFARGNRPSMP